jgi:hypothetical protein
MTAPARGLSILVAAFILLAVFSQPLLAQSGGLSMAVRDNGVTVSGVTPGNEVVLFSCAKLRKIDVGIQLDTKGRIVRDEDKDGVVTLDGAVPLRSVWIAVDQKSGAIATGSREDMPLRVSPIADSLYRKDAEGEIAALEKENPRLILLLVRPGLGAWLLQGRDGGKYDADGDANGRLKLAFESAEPVVDGKEKAPKHLKAGDVVATIDPGRLEITIGQVTK